MLVRTATPRHNLPLRQFLLSSSSHITSRPSPSSGRSWTATQRLLTTKQLLRPWKRKTSRGLVAFERNLATALDDYKPLDHLQNGAGPIYSSPRAHKQQPLYELRPLDVSSPLIVSDPPPRPPRQRINLHGISGDIDELIPVFEACLTVGKLDRAALVIKRIDSIGALDKRDLIHFHNRYLRARLYQIQEEPGLNKAEDLHQWYELQIRSAHIPHTAETIACMLKASLLTTHGARLERLVDRYMGMAPGDAGLEVLYMSDILTDQDLATITSICPTYNLLPEDQVSPVEAETTESQLAETTTESWLPANAPGTPDVLPTPQKGMGLKVLKSTLSLFAEVPEGYDISKLSYAERREIQSRLEQDSVEAAIARWREENENLMKMGLNTSISSASLSAKLYDWQNALEARLVEEFELIDKAEDEPKKSQEDLDRCIYGPLLRQSNPGRLAAVTILSTLSSLAMHGADNGVPLSMMITQLSKIAEEDIRIQARQGKGNKHTVQRGARRVLRFSPGDDATEQNSAEAGSPTTTNTSSAHQDEQSKIREAELNDPAWPLSIRTKVGAALLLALIESTKINVRREHPVTKEPIEQLQPAFSHTSQLKKGKKIGMFIPNRTLVDMMKREPRGAYIARHLPMVVEPEPWSKFDKGAFLEVPASLVRIKNGEKDQKAYTQAAIDRGDMDQVLKGLDVLGRTAWRINRPVFDVMLEAWNAGEAIADIPALNPDVHIPAEPDFTDDPMKKRQWIKAVKMAENEKSGLHSVRCFMNFQLEIARAFRDQTFYFPHNVDFRGRAYPIPTYLNHMGADHVRGLMRFAKGKELGESGLKWLRVHLSNVYGYDKASLKDRENFAVENMDNIIDSVNNPLKGKRWWLQAEDPWQCLATCYELKAAMDQPDPTKYVSHLPVHQDGTCNGLQHYAALGGDTWGAKQVNLEPGDRPADVYSAVAELVKESIAEDLDNGNPYAQALHGKITRKVVKQTVMTNVYGVTFSGAKKQVLKQIESLYPNIYKETGHEPMFLASYVATKIFKALSTMFKGAHDIQHWLGEIGSRVCRALTPEQLELINDPPAEKKTRTRTSPKAKSKAKSSTEDIMNKFKSTLVWTTPLRMPVVQPYRKSNTRTIPTCLQDLVLTVPDRSDPVNRRKQLQAFPPNFIHSLDASHMLLSALECDEKGLTFAAVHDSFWTHAADVDVMNDVIRDAFIRIHSEDVIGRLAAEFQARYSGSLYLAKVDQSSDVAKKIAAFRKKTKLTMKDELLLERRRNVLLNSSDPAEVEQGKNITTPASIFADSAAENLLEPEYGMQEATLGVIPSEELKAADALESTTATAKRAKSKKGMKRFLKLVETDHFAMRMSSAERPRTKKAPPTIQFWLPLTFPKIPEKGDFDVRRLKGSKYFFS
ncbi:DNA/RNA polymerase [Coniochaeta ligniaria NRRL 30616]|uniref:DNA-directed RNA polymerase n=1 Tax=Coniochaeta ligniaria NRRL 30616 TaxID=1408157 RepID=A0A1J7IML3_9PEZI|nr:DNA/RNA polymerase [Coniochaeta ligniaria NRRL 30616]